MPGRVRPPSPSTLSRFCVLTIGSGGVRGIIQLKILEAIQKELGKDLKIQWFFDLVVGTRYLHSQPKSWFPSLTQRLFAAAREELPL